MESNHPGLPYEGRCIVALPDSVIGGQPFRGAAHE